jgi:hypothetical protein
MKTRTQVCAGLLLTAVIVFPLPAQEVDLRSARVFPPCVITNGCIYLGTDVKGTNHGRAEVAFTLESEGRYHVSVRGKGISGCRQELWIGIDTEPDIRGALGFVLTNGVPGEVVGFTTHTARGFKLAAGVHKLIVSGRSANTQLEQFTLIPGSRLGAPPPPPGSLRFSAAPR